MTAWNPMTLRKIAVWGHLLEGPRNSCCRDPEGSAIARAIYYAGSVVVIPCLWIDI